MPPEEIRGEVIRARPPRPVEWVARPPPPCDQSAGRVRGSRRPRRRTRPDFDILPARLANFRGPRRRVGGHVEPLGRRWPQRRLLGHRVETRRAATVLPPSMLAGALFKVTARGGRDEMSQRVFAPPAPLLERRTRVRPADLDRPWTSARAASTHRAPHHADREEAVGMGRSLDIGARRNARFRSKQHSAGRAGDPLVTQVVPRVSITLLIPLRLLSKRQRA